MVINNFYKLIVRYHLINRIVGGFLRGPVVWAREFFMGMWSKETLILVIESYPITVLTD